MTDITPFTEADVEAVARAICCRLGCEARHAVRDAIAGSVAVCQAPRFRGGSRAALRAISARLRETNRKVLGREPTEAMIAEGRTQRATLRFGSSAIGGEIGEWPARDAWTRMWGAAP